MTTADLFMFALTIWRENRGGGRVGMQSCGNVILNRAARRKTSPYEECVRAWQFSSITAPGDPELTIWPRLSDAQWIEAQALARNAALGNLPDITGGATSYFALSLAEPPSWAATMTKTVEIAGQAFYC